jgi:hypothetical protein
MVYELYLMKITHIFLRIHFILKKTWFILKFYKYALINELYKIENVNENKTLGINALLLFDYPKK